MFDVVIIGAGPAGLSAAAIAAENGLGVKLIDEFVKPGGRLLGQLHEEPDGVWWNGVEESEKLLLKLINLGVDIDCGTSVHQLNREENHWVISTNNGTFMTERVLIATGAAEAAEPLPGWTLPGVMSIGAAQVMTNVHRVAPGKNGIIIGVNILATAIARELQLAGVNVTSMVLPPLHTLSRESGNPQHVFESLLRVSNLAPAPLIRVGSSLIRKSSLLKQLGIHLYPKTGIKVWDIPVHLRKAATHIIGEEKAEAVGLVDITANGDPIQGTEQDIKVDFVCIAGGLYPLAELAAVAGCPFYYIPELGGHIPLHNEKMETPLPGLFVAGNITGIESAKVAMAQGIVAGLSISKHFNPANRGFDQRIQEAIQKVKDVRSNALIQFHPGINEGRQKMEKIWNEKQILVYS